MIFASHAHPAISNLQALQSIAANLLDDFEADMPVEQLLRKARAIQQLYDATSDQIPPHSSKDYLSKHIHFLNFYLEHDKAEKCTDDLEDICRKDIPRLCSFLEKKRLEAHYDPELAQRVFPLLNQHHLDAAVREAFVVLKTRIVNTFSLSTRLDGAALVNALLGGSGKITPVLGKEEAQTFRNLLDGLYGAFRNNFSHNIVNSEWEDAAGVIAMINLVLKLIDQWGARMRDGVGDVNQFCK